MTTPIPLTQCMGCGGTMWKQDHWIQCPDCGAMSTRFGGCYPNLQPGDGTAGASDEFKAAVDAAKLNR